MFKKLFEGEGREGNNWVFKKKKGGVVVNKALKLSQSINIFQGNKGVMKEGDGRKAITMLSSRNSPVIAWKAIQKALEIGAVCCLHSLGGKKKIRTKPQTPSPKKGKVRNYPCCTDQFTRVVFPWIVLMELHFLLFSCWPISSWLLKRSMNTSHYLCTKWASIFSSKFKGLHYFHL